jgi:hypothetical protein
MKRIGGIGITLCSSETSVLTRATQRNIPEDIIPVIPHIHRREELKYFVTLTGWSLYRRRNVFPVRNELEFISQKTAFLVTAVKTLNSTFY